ncbi:MAG: ribose-phosphate diphosphokinase [Candidatus Hadarchaeota archaeon]
MKQAHIIYGRQGKEFAKKIWTELKDLPEGEKISLTGVKTEVFNDGELKPQINDSVRGRDVYVVQRFHKHPHGVNEDLMELLLINDAAKRASAESIINVLPYFPYSRQDKMVDRRVPISAKKVVSMLEEDVDGIITMDIHSKPIQGFSKIPIDNLEAKDMFTKLIEERWNKEEVVLVSPDLGSAERVESYSKILEVERATIRKVRGEENRPETREVEGKKSLEGKNAIIIDDMIDTGGTIKKAAELLKEEGSQEINVLTTHPIFSEPATKRLSNLGINVIGTDTIPHHKEFLDENQQWFEVETVSQMFAEAIYRDHTGKSFSESEKLFNQTR